jgi:hypothetical protein
MRGRSRSEACFVSAAARDTCSVYHCSEFEIGSPLRRERKLLADKCSRLAKVRTSQWTALPEAAKMTAHLARGEIVALLQITHLMGGIGQLVSVNCDVSRQRVRGGRGSLDLA